MGYWIDHLLDMAYKDIKWNLDVEFHTRMDTTDEDKIVKARKWYKRELEYLNMKFRKITTES